MTHPATAEETWASWPRLRELAPLPLPRGHIVVVSAHPDDEVLGAGGLLAGLGADADSADTTDVRFVMVTDGEASHPGQPGVVPGLLVRQRVAELTKSLHVLGHQAPWVSRLRLPDSEVADHVDELAYRLERAIAGADLVLCPAADDGHPDHATVGRVTRGLCAGQVPVWEFPIWMWHWTAPGDGALPWERAHRFELSAEAVARKSRALACLTSQIQPLPLHPPGDTILPPEMLAHFTRPFEVFLT